MGCELVNQARQVFRQAGGHFGCTQAGLAGQVLQGTLAQYGLDLRSRYRQVGVVGNPGGNDLAQPVFLKLSAARLGAMRGHSG